MLMPSGRRIGYNVSMRLPPNIADCVSTLGRQVLLAGVLFGCGSCVLAAGEPRPAGGDVVELTEVLADSSSHYALRRAAAYELGRRGTAAAPAVEALVAALDDRQLELVWYAMDALGRLGPAARPAVPAMVAAMQNPANDAVLRVTAAESLGRLGPTAEAALPALREAWGHEEAAYRSAAAAAVWKIAADPAALEQLGAALRSTDDEVAYLAASTAAELGRVDHDAFPRAELAIALGDGNRDVRHAAARALANQGPAAVQQIITAARARPVGKEKLEASIAALRWIGEQARRGAEENARADGGELEAVVPGGASEAISFLLDLTASGDADIRRQSAAALCGYGLYAMPAVVRRMTAAEARGQATRIAALEKMIDQLPPRGAGPPEHDEAYRTAAAEELLQAMRHEQVEVRRAAVRGYAALGVDAPGDEVRRLLQTLLADPDLRVRRYAADALQ